MWGQLFARLSSLLSPNDLAQPSPPEPDLIAPDDAQGTIGIEVTRLFGRGHILRDVQGNQDTVTAEAERLYAAGGGPGVEVLVYWSSSARTKPTERHTLASDLAETALRITPPLGSYWTSDSGDELPNGIGYLRVSHLVDLDEPVFVPSRSGFQHELTDTDVRATLSRKNHKYNGYSGSCGVLWLLLVIEQTGPASFACLTGKAQTMRYESVFERIFVLEPGHQRYSELKLTILPRGAP